MIIFVSKLLGEYLQLQKSFLILFSHYIIGFYIFTLLCISLYHCFRMSKKSKFASEEVFVAITPLQLDPAHAEEILALAKRVPSFRQEEDKNLDGIHVCFADNLNERF